MKWTHLYTAVALLGMVGSAVAGNIQQVHYTCGTEKACGCAPTCQPTCCRPVVCRPECPKVCTYQRQCCKPNCCGLPQDKCCGPKCAVAAAPCCPPVTKGWRNWFRHADPCCRPVDTGCNKACDPCCKPVDPICAAPCTKPADPCCKPVDPGCAAPCTKPADPCCKPVDPGCAAPCTKPACDPACAAPCKKVCDPVCAAPCKPACPPVCAAAPCCDAPKIGVIHEPICCNYDPCEVAHWIYVSQTACYARQRAKALDILGDRFDCRCSPEIMCAFIYGLNDADERVRREAADSIRKQVRKHSCCCNEKVVCALANALADCDRRVRKEAEKALRVCGYDVVDCNQFAVSCGQAACGQVACGNHGPAMGHTAPKPTMAPPAAAPMTPPPAPAAPAAPAAAPATGAAPAPAAEPEAYFPSKLKTSKTRSGLSNLFGLK
jgi:hypothetical protein